MEHQLSFDYMLNKYMLVSDKQDFFRTALPEISKLRTICSSCANLFKVPQTNISIAISKNEGDKTYRIGVESKQAGIIALIYYIPSEARLDIYDSDPKTPLIAWKNRRCVFKNYSELLKVLNLDKLFQPLITGL